MTRYFSIVSRGYKGNSLPHSVPRATSLTAKKLPLPTAVLSFDFIAIMSIINSNDNISPSQGYLTRDVSPQLNVFQLNIDGISPEKSSYLSRLPQELKADVVILQETHTPNEQQLHK